MPISDEVLIHLGALTLNFGTLEAIVGFHAASLLECRDRAVAELVTRELSFDRKLQRIVTITEYLAYGKPQADEAVKRIKDLASQAKKAAEHRNDLVHGKLTYTADTGDFITTNKKRSRNLESAEIENLVKECLLLGVNFQQAIGEFGRAIESADTEQARSTSENQP